MPSIRADAFRQQIARKATDPVVLIVGDDEHEKTALAVAAGDMVEEDLRAFNVERLYATDKSVTPMSVVEAARTLPMLVSRRIVIVLAAEKLLVPKKKGAAAEDDQDGGDVEPLIDYFGSPSPETTLILVCSPGETPDAIPLPKNLRITKALAAAATVVTCSGLDGGKDPSRPLASGAREGGRAGDRPAGGGEARRSRRRRSRAAARGRRETAAVCVGQREGHARSRARHCRRTGAPRRRLGTRARAGAAGRGHGASRASGVAERRRQPVPDSRPDRRLGPLAAQPLSAAQDSSTIAIRCSIRTPRFSASRSIR